MSGDVAIYQASVPDRTELRFFTKVGATDSGCWQWGHEFTPENTYETGGKRACRTCRATRRARYSRGVAA